MYNIQIIKRLPWLSCHLNVICVSYVYHMCIIYIYVCIIIFKLFRCRKRQVMSRPGSARRERSRRGGSATGPGLGTITVDTLWDTRCGTHFRHVSTSFNIFRHVDVGNWRLADRDMSRHVETSDCDMLTMCRCVVASCTVS